MIAGTEYCEKNNASLRDLVGHTGSRRVVMLGTAMIPAPQDKTQNLKRCSRNICCTPRLALCLLILLQLRFPICSTLYPHSAGVLRDLRGVADRACGHSSDTFQYVHRLLIFQLPIKSSIDGIFMYVYGRVMNE